jgi:multidrug transporter EmrE-like cation transporter
MKSEAIYMEASSKMIFVLLTALVAILLLVGGQTLLKVGLNAIGGVSLFGGDALGSLLGLFRTPWIILGLVCYAVSSVLWLDVLSKLDFSLAFPLVSLTYIFQLVIGRFVFHETVGLERVVGVLLILGGLFFVVRSGR